jgi:hypothetical protein
METEGSNNTQKANKAIQLKFLVVVLIVAVAVLLVALLRPEKPPEYPSDPNYKLPGEARFLPPETQELLRDALSRIKPLPSTEEGYKKGKKFAKQASNAHPKLFGLRDAEIEQKAQYCIDNAIAAINLNYHGHHVHGILADTVRLSYMRYHSRWRREFMDAYNVFDVNCEKPRKLISARSLREESCRRLILALVYHRAAEFDDKFKQNYDEQLYVFEFKWEGYIDFLTKGLTWDYGNLIREGDYEQTIKHIDDIFTNMKHIPRPKSYREFEFHGTHSGGVPDPPKPMMTEEERQEKLSVVLDALQYDTANPWDKIGAYDDFANLMGGFNFMINDPFLNQIMIFSTRQHIFEKATEREMKLSGEDSLIYKQLLKEATDAEYIKKHYELLYREEKGELPNLLQKINNK